MGQEFKIKNGLIVSGSAEITNNLTVNGTLTAEEYHISLVSSSVLYESGSTKFGDSSDDTHEFTGSLNISGSIFLNGTTVGTGKLDETTFESFTSSYIEVSSSLDERVGDLELFSSSLDMNFVSETEFGSFTSSIKDRVDDLETESGSIRGDFNSFTSSYTNVSTSIDSRLDNLETLSGSFTGSFSGSFTGDGTNLYNIPASGVTGLNLTQIADGSVTASVSNTNGLRVNSKTEITGSLIVTDGITGSIDYSNITNKPTLVSGSIQIDITGTTGYSTFSSSISNSVSSLSSSLGSISQSIATTDLNQDNRLNSLESASGSIRTDFNSFTSSYTTVSGSLDSRLDVLEAYSGSQLVPSASMSFRTLQTDVYCKNVSGAQINKGTVVRIVGATGDNPLIGVADPTTEHTSANVLGIATVNIPNDGFGLVITEGVLTGVNTNGMIAGDLLYLGPNGTFTTTPTIAPNHGVRLGEVLRVQQNNGSIYVRVDNGIELNEAHDVIYNDITSGDLLVRSGSVWKNSKQLTGSYALTGSLIVTGGLTGSIDYSNITNKPTLVSGSSQISITGTTGFSDFSSSISSSLGDLSSSVATTNLNQNNRLNSLEGITGSYATTGSNSFVGNQTITGSLTVTNNFTVLGSSSIVYSTASQLIVEDNVIVVNASFPAERFAGLEVHDSGSNGSVTASLFWDGLYNRWIYQNSSEAHYGGAMFIAGPRNTGSLGEETTLTNGRIPRSIGGDHIGDSIMNEISGSIGISGSLSITGSIVSTGTPIVSGSSQISFNGITDKPTLVSGSSQVSFNGITDKPSLVSGSSQIDLTAVTNYSSGIKTRLNTEGVISGSSQVLNGSGVWSGSAQLPAGVVSGSSQVLAGTTIHSGSFFNGITVVSGSSQISFNGITDRPTLVSGSSQITYSGLTGIPSGIVSGSSQVLNGSGIWSGSAQLPVGVVSGSSQISFGGITGVPSGLVSGSSQVLTGTTIHSGSFFNNISVVSGSAQISFGGITGVPSGLVSGSSQIDLTAVTNYSSGIKTRLNTEVVHSGSFLGTATTANLTENTNLYYTDTRSRAALSFTAGSGAYNSTTGVITIPTNTNQLTNGAGFLTSVTNISGNAGTVTNGVYTTGDQTISGTKTFNGTHLAIENSTNVWKYIRYRTGSTILWDVGTNEADDSSSYQIRPNGNSTNRLTLSLSGVLTVSGNILPSTNNSFNLGSPSVGWANIYTNDLHLSNMNKPEGNDIDGTSGTWTIQEGAENLYIINNRNNKKFKISLEEIL